MMKCGMCKFWAIIEDGYNHGYPPMSERGIKECTKAVMMWDASEWSRVGDDVLAVLKPDMQDQKLFVQDGSDYRAYLFTREDFFCAHFEALPPA